MSKPVVQASQIGFLRRSSESKIILKFLTLPYLHFETVSFSISKMWLILFLISLSFRSLCVRPKGVVCSFMSICMFVCVRIKCLTSQMQNACSLSSDSWQSRHLFLSLSPIFPSKPGTQKSLYCVSIHKCDRNTTNADGQVLRRSTGHKTLYRWMAKSTICCGSLRENDGGSLPTSEADRKSQSE